MSPALRGHHACRAFALDTSGDDGLPLATTTGAVEAMSLWAGESAGGVTRVQPAADIVRELAEGAERLLRRWT